MPKFWNFTEKPANESEPEFVELQIKGDIVDDEDVWIYELFGMKSASPNAFRDELAKYKGKDITVRINSYGGSVWAAAGMYNALVDHKKTGGKILTRTDEKAMSAATIPFMAGDVRQMGAVDIFMIHNPLTEVYGYASDLRKTADVLDEVKETIVNAYQIGTGRSRAKISQLMDEETYMNAKTANKEGFVTEMIGETTEKAEIVDFTFNRSRILNSSSEAMKRMVAIQKPNTGNQPPGNEHDTTLIKAKLALEIEML